MPMSLALSLWLSEPVQRAREPDFVTVEEFARNQAPLEMVICEHLWKTVTDFNDNCLQYLPSARPSR